MSYDLAVWSSKKRLTDEEAGKVYIGLCEGKHIDLPADRAIDEFYKELTALHPEIDSLSEEEIEDKDLCPWSIAHDYGPNHIVMCCIWPKADYVYGLVLKMAKQYALAVFDPQEGKIIYPEDLSVDSSQKDLKRPWWKFW